MNKIKIFSTITITSFLLQACFTMNYQAPVKKNSDYSQSAYKLHPEFKIFHIDNNQSKLYYQIYTGELKYAKTDAQSESHAQLKVSYFITPSFSDTRLLDSASFIHNLKYVSGQTSIVASVDIKNIKFPDYLITIKFYDIYGNRKSTDYIKVNRSKPDNSQYFITLNKNNLKPFFKDYVSASDTIIIRQTDTEIPKLFVKYYKAEFDVPAPPFYVSQEQQGKDVYPDSVFTLNFNKQAFFTAPQKGIYRIQSDTVANNGTLKIVFDKYFPEIKTSKTLAQAVQYIASTEEYTAIIQSDNIKLALDEFWIRCAGNTDKARELLKIWYKRAVYSNYYFTSYKEGWKTDRGMIFMVFGSPHNVKYFDYGEQWIYYDTKGDKPIFFNFEKQVNSVSDNDFVLKRNISYHTFWYRAVDSWRKGSVYIYQN